MRFLSMSKRRDEPELSLVPLIDVVLVILIFLSVTTTFSPIAQLGIDLPNADRETEKAQSQSVVIALDAAGEVFLEGEALGRADVETLRQRLAARVPSGEQPWVVIEADAATPHQRVVDALRAAQRAGLTRIAFAVEQQP